MDIPDQKYDDEVFSQLHEDQLYADEEGVLSKNPEEEQSFECQEEDSFEASNRLLVLTVKERLVEVAQVNRNFFIKIFTDTFYPRRRFFFEPIVQMDRKQIVIEGCDLFQQDVLHFTVQMWNQELLSLVLERLRLLPELGGKKIHEDNIFFLPFEDVHLVYQPGSIPEEIQLFNRQISYLDMQMPKFLNFYLLSNSSAAALALADDFRRNLEFSWKKWQLKLVGRGLDLDKVTSSDWPVFSFNVYTIPLTQFQGNLFHMVIAYLCL